MTHAVSPRLKIAATSTAFQKLLIGTMFVSFLMFSQREVGSVVEGGLDRTRIARGVLLALVWFLVMLRSLATRHYTWVKAAFRLPLSAFGIYVAWAAISILYSGDRMLSGAKVFELSTDLLAIAFIYGTTNGALAWENIWKFTMKCLVGLILSYVAITVVTNQQLVDFIGVFPIWVGFGGRNGLTQIGAIVGLFALSRFFGVPSQRLQYSFLLVFCCAVMLVSYSRTSIFIFAMLAGVIMLKYRRLAILLVLGTGAALLVTAAGEEVVAYFLRGQTQETFLGLTGRIDVIWAGAILLILQSPILGYGYYYGTTHLAPLAIFGSYDVPFTNVDNTFLEVMLNLGAVGLAVFTLIWLAAGRTLLAYRRMLSGFPRTLLFWECALVIVSTFIRSWVNPTIAYHHWNTMVFWIALGALAQGIVNVQQRREDIGR
jgi:O-antigen ligase